MISFRKHADVTRRPTEAYPDTLQTRQPPFLRALAFAIGIFLTSALSANAQTQVTVGPLAKAGPPTAAEEKSEAAAPAETPAENTKEAKAGSGAKANPGNARPAWLEALPDAPMRIQLTGTPDEPVVVATIGDFAADLGEDGKFFLRREFIEHFVANVLELGGPSHASPMISFLTQSEENGRECIFKIGNVSGRLSVLVTPRRVFVMCSFSEDEKDMRNLAALKHRLSLSV
jgi:hypothetical protein